MSQIKRYRKKKIKSKQKADQLKSAVLKLSLIMLNFMFATFAWFTYTKILNPTVDVNVSAWQVDFKDKDADDVLGTSMDFTVGRFYPGMADYTKEIEILNLGDRAASITYEIEELIILGKEYTIKTTPEAGDSDNTVYKSIETVYKVDENEDIVIDLEGNPVVEKYVEKLLNNSSKYPFEIIITYSPHIDIASNIVNNQNKGKFEICFTWPYEAIVEEGQTPTEEQMETKNTLDTKWGYDIANFYKEKGDAANGIEISLQAIASQVI